MTYCSVREYSKKVQKEEAQQKSMHYNLQNVPNDLIFIKTAPWTRKPQRKVTVEEASQKQSFQPNMHQSHNLNLTATPSN